MQLASGTLLQGGKYRIIRTLGQGGFGITYEAEQIALGQTVAIKEFYMRDCCERRTNSLALNIGIGAQRDLVLRFKAKFIKEAKTISNFKHNNIVKILDIFEDNETAYYVMECLSGGSLAHLLAISGQLSEESAIRYIRQVASALDYVHEHNTVHMDVKPSNILLDSQGNAVLIDFGTSKHYDSVGEQTTTTPIGYSKGYAPLEQYRDGDVSQFKPATDIYALGATLYTLVTGKIPPEAPVIVNEGGLDRVSGISDNVWATISNAMMPRFIDRPQSVSEFLNILLDEATVVNDRNNIEEEVEQVYEEYYIKGNETIKKNPVPGLFLHETHNRLSDKWRSWYEINGQKCTDYFEGGSHSIEGFLLRADSYFYVLPSDYLEREQLVKWDIYFRTSIGGYGIWNLANLRGYYPAFPDAVPSTKTYEWEGAKYPCDAERWLWVYISDSHQEIIAIYPDYAVLLSLHITQYSTLKKIALDCRGRVFAQEVSRINRDFVNEAHVEAKGAIRTVLNSKSSESVKRTQDTEGIKSHLENCRAIEYVKSTLPPCDTERELACPKTDAKGYYLIERAGAVGMRHYLDDGRIQEIFPFYGKDDVDFEDAWLRLHPNDD